MHTKTCQNYLWLVLRRTICHIKAPSRLPALLEAAGAWPVDIFARYQ